MSGAGGDGCDDMTCQAGSAVCLQSHGSGRVLEADGETQPAASWSPAACAAASGCCCRATAAAPNVLSLRPVPAALLSSLSGPAGKAFDRVLVDVPLITSLQLAIVDRPSEPFFDCSSWFILHVWLFRLPHGPTRSKDFLLPGAQLAFLCA